MEKRKSRRRVSVTGLLERAVEDLEEAKRLEKAASLNPMWALVSSPEGLRESALRSQVAVAYELERLAYENRRGRLAAIGGSTGPELEGTMNYGDIAAGLSEAGFQGKTWSYSCTYKRIRRIPGEGIFRELRRLQLKDGKFPRGEVEALLARVAESEKAGAVERRKTADATRMRKAEERRVAESLGNR